MTALAKIIDHFILPYDDIVVRQRDMGLLCDQGQVNEIFFCKVEWFPFSKYTLIV